MTRKQIASFNWALSAQQTFLKEKIHLVEFVSRQHREILETQETEHACRMGPSWRGDVRKSCPDLLSMRTGMAPPRMLLNPMLSCSAMQSPPKNEKGTYARTSGQSFGFTNLYQLTGEGNIARHFDSKQGFERFHASAERYVKPMKNICD